jgi:large subunit ribosomal protein L14
MVQIGTVLNVIDNSGAKKAYCIRINNTSEKKYGSIGNSILVVVKSLRKKRKVLSKVKKGEIYSALVVRTKTKNFSKTSDSFFSLENSVILLNKQQKFIGTRIFGSLPKLFRSTKYMKVLSLCSGFVS